MLTQFGDFSKLQSVRLVQNLPIIAFAGDIDAQNDGLIHHLIKMNSGAYILRYLGFGVYE